MCIKHIVLPCPLLDAHMCDRHILLHTKGGTDMTYATSTDARTASYAVQDWAWGGNASFDGFCKWLWENNPEYEYSDEALKAYLQSVGENPADYSL
jgi:hypothetical protein